MIAAEATGNDAREIIATWKLLVGAFIFGEHLTEEKTGNWILF